MLDVAFIRDHLDAVKANCKNRNVSADVDRVVALDDQRKQLVGNRIYRPEQISTGKTGVKYVPLEQRP